MSHAKLALLAPLVATALVAFAPVAAAQDAQAGRKKAAMCIGCHGIPGYQASFPEIHKVPMIGGQNAKYIVAALTAYKKGERKHGSMRAIAGSLSEQDMADLAAYYEKNGTSSIKTVADTAAPAAPADVAALLAKGACASCHGASYSKPIDGSYPKIAGQHADYLYVALKAYQTDGNPRIGRSNAVMSTQARQFKRAELKAMAEYLASLPGELNSAAQSSLR
ncbi:MAG TPA: c-type cytochrome [Rubrivivax sp.]|jgi:cytochrome c553|nr:c-type cytochrome [Rubrivivax sp.]